MQNKLAKIISSILAPLVIVIPATFLVSYFGTKNVFLSFEWMLVSLVFILILMAPLVFFVKKGQFANLDVSVQQQRPLLFLIEFIFALVYFAVLYFFHAPKELFIGIITIFVLLIVFGFVNKFIKTSGHVGMLAAIIALFVLKGGPIFLLGFILVPILAWSRIKLKRHTLGEVIVGLLVGVLVAALVVII
jgi:membrane-associated phospholipid phosphatase